MTREAVAGKLGMSERSVYRVLATSVAVAGTASGAS